MQRESYLGDRATPCRDWMWLEAWNRNVKRIFSGSKCDNSRHKPFFWAAGRHPADAYGLFGASAPPGGHDWPLPEWPGLCAKALHSLAATVGSPLLTAPGCSATYPTHVHAPAGRPNAKKSIVRMGWEKGFTEGLINYSKKLNRDYMRKTICSLNT